MAMLNPLRDLRRRWHVTDILSTTKKTREIEIAFLARFAQVVVRTPRRRASGSWDDFEITLHAMHDPTFAMIANKHAKDVPEDQGFDVFGGRDSR